MASSTANLEWQLTLQSAVLQIRTFKSIMRSPSIACSNAIDSSKQLNSFCQSFGYGKPILRMIYLSVARMAYSSLCPIVVFSHFSDHMI